jgi:hypothetical protein
VDWIFPTDCPAPETNGTNLKFLPLTLKEFNAISSNIFGFPVQIKHPYKICDLKPAFGELFEEHLKDYEFWGYGDLDLVYGNIREFVSDNDLDEHDIISNHPDFITGHFCLLRNTRAIKELYKKGGAYKTCFANEKYTGFDEQLKEFSINPDPKILGYEQKLDRTAHIVKHRIRKKVRGIYPGKESGSEGKTVGGELIDFTSIVRNTESSGKLKVRYRKTFESDLMLSKEGLKKWEMTWENGNLSNREGESLLYFHFIMSKMNKSFLIDEYRGELRKFRINPSGIRIQE